jgi:membrane-bound lytic murein transglycosylase B
MTDRIRRPALGIRLATLAGAWLLLAAFSTDEPGVPRSNGEPFDLERPEIAAFIDQVVTRDGLQRAEVTAALGAAVVRPELTAEMKQAPEKTLDWWQYRLRFVTPGRIENGVRFIKEHQAVLDEIAAQSGVPPEYLAAILGIETNYGQITGTFREVDTLMTYAFDYPERGQFFRSELRAFLLLARDLGRDPTTIRGSYGGALGVPQLMPSNYRKFSAQYAGGGAVDLWTDWRAIVSGVADFLAARGWERNGLVLEDASAADDVRIEAPAHFGLDETIDSLRAKGIAIDKKVKGSTPVLVIPAVVESGLKYRVGFRNFYVITRYNPRVNYAMAVCDLAQAMRLALAEPHA